MVMHVALCLATVSLWFSFTYTSLIFIIISVPHVPGLLLIIPYGKAKRMLLVTGGLVVMLVPHVVHLLG